MHRIGTSERPDLALAVIVGAGGLGVALARRMANSHRVLLVDIDGARAEAEAERLRGEGCDASAWQCDITLAEDLARFSEHLREIGGFQAAVVVAGISPSGGSFRQIMTVNLHGAALVTDVLRGVARPGNVAIMISSMGGHMASPTPEAVELLKHPADPGMAAALEYLLGAEEASPSAAYTLSKWGMNLMCRRQAPAWGERGARIVSVSPGLIATPMGAREFKASETKRAIYGKTPILRECTMLEIADGVEFLASPRASFITGTDLLIDGGLVAALKDS